VDGGEGAVREHPSKGREQEVKQAVDEAERDIAQGNWVENSEILKKLKRWANKAKPGNA
jgi:predicted transcriptional regulator